VRPKNLARTLKMAVQAGENVMLVGAPGVGKSQIVEQLARELDAEIVMIHAVTSDPTDCKGLGFPDAGGEEAKFLPYGDMVKLMKAEKLTIAFLDDFGQACTAVQASYMQAVEAHQVNGHKLSDKVAWIAATNRRGDRSGVSGILEAVKGRFTIIELDCHVDDTVEWMQKNGMPPELPAFLKFKPGMISDLKPTAEMTNSPSPRNWAAVGRWQNLGIPAVDRFEVFKGRVGEAAATEYCGFLEICDKLPAPSTIINDPEGAVVPTEPSVLFALSGALTRHVKEHPKDFGPVLRYAHRIPPEFSVMLVMGRIHADKTLAGNTPEFRDWAVKYHQVLVQQN
jgi:hypothetical protein